MATILPDFSTATFVPGTVADNAYFPLTSGTVYSYEGEVTDEETGEIELESNQVFVTFDTKNILGIEAQVVRDRAFVDGVLVEDTFDWYAQDTEGNVWYLGEIATNYEYDDEGNLIDTNNDGSWQAGVDGALPGFLMEANPQVGDSYYQEFFLGEAEDEAEVISLDESVSIGLGNFNNVLKTRDFTALEPDVFEFKYYAPGIGQILGDEGLTEEVGEPEASPELVSMDVFGNIIFGEAGNDRLQGDVGNDLINGVAGRDRIWGKEGDDQLYGEDGNDKLWGGIGNDLINGGAGRDHIRGNEGDDQLYGEDGNDKLWGGLGDDLINGGAGRDRLFGNQGSDTFVIAVGEGRDRIVDFEIGADLIGLTAGLSFSQLSFHNSEIRFGDEILATLSGVDTTSLSEASFVLV